MSDRDAAQMLSFFRAARRLDPPFDSTSISQLRDKAEKVKETIQQLKTQLQILEDHLEALQDSLSTIVYPINTLPAEILCHIFAEAVSSSHSLDVNSTLLQITAVCPRWRRTAIADPHLWTRVSYLIDGERDILAEHFLRRTQGLPVVFSIPEEANDYESYDLPRCIFDSAPQWAEASLCSIKWPVNWAAADSESDTPANAQFDFPLLTKFAFDVWRPIDTGERPVLMNAPRLQELSISIPRLVLRLSFPAHQLQKLTILRPTTCTEILSVITHLAALEELSLSSLFEEDIPASNLYLPRLSTLSLVADDSSSILDHLLLPALTTLCLSDLHYFIVESSIDPAIERSAATVTSLSLLTPVSFAAFRYLLTSYTIHPVKHLTVTAFSMTNDQGRKCSAMLAESNLLSNLESFTLVIPASAPAPVNIRPFLDGIAMRVADMCSDGVQRKMKLARFVVEFAPYGILEKDIRDLQHLQRTFGIKVSMPNGHPRRKSWE
ncbi:hypothetical protein MIND_00001100 [Mycena indigotica]|uniref:F-box domain-containing protein n=1 Tax=Mycena indigotica TaxID=2126181 RepID=A0A8H6WJT4_9AGAR|nr:uncharacterized protein MIND_00001100 [Mycena indigotica]KAF7314874.1 hypothetical protein MIND_00001100 [Mycena indigotica]